MSTNQDRYRQVTGLFSRADPSVERSVPPEVGNIELLGRPLEIISDDYNLGDWQETPSKIIRHNGFYHVWIIDTPLGGRNAARRHQHHAVPEVARRRAVAGPGLRPHRCRREP